MFPKFDVADKSAAIYAVLGLVGTAFAYMSEVNWVWAEVDKTAMLNWMAAIGAALGISNRISRKSPNQEAIDAPVVEPDIEPDIDIHNPGNLRPNARYKWQGQIGIHRIKGKGTFVKFKNNHYGLRAMARNLKNQWRLHKLNTIEGIIYKYAPKEDDNDPEAYTAFVARRSGYSPTEPLDMEDNKVIVTLMAHMIHMEKGFNEFSTAALLSGAKAA